MTGESDMTVSTERLLGAELIRAAEAVMAGLRPEVLEPALAVQLVTVQVLLGLYWELRRQRLPASSVERLTGALAGPPERGVAASVEWLSALLRSCRPEVTDPPPQASSGGRADGEAAG